MVTSPEDADDDLYTALPLRRLLDQLIAARVTVVAAAGNNATRRTFYPAALATSGDEAESSILSVGALNPNGSKAFFSNDGPWVNTWDRGAALISTYPPGVQGSRAPSGRVQPAGGTRRESVDIDDFSSGFAVWSGTSFAAPVVAARLLSLLAEQPTTPADLTDPGAPGRAAVAAVKVYLEANGAVLPADRENTP